MMISLLDIIGIGTVYAAGDAAGATQSGAAAGITSMLPMFIGFGLIFYFLIIRPQNKRQREHRDLLASVSDGDEVLTAGGILGTVNKVEDDFLELGIANNVSIKIKKSSIATILPKGTVEEDKN